MYQPEPTLRIERPDDHEVPGSFRELSMVLSVEDRQGTLEQTLLDTSRALEELCERWELVVVDDGSEDRTPRILAEWAAGDPRVRVLTQRPRQGVSRALARGFLAARFLMIACGDATGRVDPRQLLHMLPLLREAHMVAGVRRGTAAPKGLPDRLSRRLLRKVLGERVRDPHCPLKLFRRSFLELVRPECDGRMIHAELFFRARGANLSWIEAEVDERAGGPPEPQRPGWHDLLQVWRLSRRI